MIPIGIVASLAILGVAGSTTSPADGGFCLIRSTPARGRFWYQCVKSSDYLANVKRAPVDVTRLSFGSCRIPTIQDYAFLRLGKSLQDLIIFHSGIQAIEDDAFRGLDNLTSLALQGNNLTVIKGVWFDGLASLKSLRLQNNRVKRIESSVFASLPPLDNFDIADNHLTDLPVESLPSFRARTFAFRHNPFTWTCLAYLSKWLADTNAHSDEMILNSVGSSANNFDLPFELVRMCVRQLPPGKPEEDSMDRCIAKLTNELLPNKEQYTIAEVCQRQRTKLSPFLNCIDGLQLRPRA